MFTIMLVIFLSDFLVRGYADDNISHIPKSEAYQYQLIVLLILTMVVFSTALVNSPRLEGNFRHAKITINLSQKSRRILYIAAFSLLMFDVTKRLSAVEWSLNEVIRQSLLPRGTSDWALAANSGNFLFSITTILLPLAAVVFAYLITSTHGLQKFILFLLFGFTLILLITNGSRTPVAVSLGALALFAVRQQRSLGIRIVTLVVMVGMLAMTLSAMYLNRASGYLSGGDNNLSLTYHQDDSYYRALYAYAHADRSAESWDPVVFFTTIAVNPVPRALWPNKPVLSSEFYGGFKLDYVTNLFLGEMVAMTGVNLSILVSPAVGFTLYLIMFNAQRLLILPMGIVAYLILGLYTYMSMRSLQNIMQFIYLPFFSVALALTLRAIQGRRT